MYEARGRVVWARLLNGSRESKVSFNSLWEPYATGRFLWRLSQSRYQARFVLKEAQLFLIWESGLHRATRNLDFLGSGDLSEARLAVVFGEICNLPNGSDDGLKGGRFASGRFGKRWNTVVFVRTWWHLWLILSV